MKMENFLYVSSYDNRSRLHVRFRRSPFGVGFWRTRLNNESTFLPPRTSWTQVISVCLPKNFPRIYASTNVRFNVFKNIYTTSWRCAVSMFPRKRVLTPQPSKVLGRGQHQVQAINGAQMKHEETDGVEPDNLPFVHVFRWFRRFRRSVTLPVVIGFGQLFAQCRHALRVFSFCQTPCRKTIACPRGKCIRLFGFTGIA